MLMGVLFINMMLEQCLHMSLKNFDGLSLEVYPSLFKTLTIGVDGSLSVLSFVDGEDNLRVAPPVPQEQIVRLAKEARLLLNWSENQVKLWEFEEIVDERIQKRYLLNMELNVSPSLKLKLIIDR